MSIRTSALGLLVASIGVFPASHLQAEDDPFISAIKEGKLLADIRVRYEGVEDKRTDAKDARGLTIRTRLGYQTGSLAGFKLLGEFTDTRPVFGVDEFAPESAGYAVIADPSGTALNRAVISYEAWDNSWVGVGRQRIILDNARWVGNVGWRQKEQTFDAGSLDLNFGKSWKLSYDYMTRVNGVVEQLNFDARNHIANLAFTGWDFASLVGYGYFLENEDTKNIRNTVGLRFNGSTKPDNITWLYTAEYARQKFELDQPQPATGRDDFEFDYISLMGGIGFKNITLKAQYEVLGSDGSDAALQTPLATKFAFNGWADLFLATPDAGLRDASIDFSANWLGLKWGAVYHDFSADDGSDHYGSEIDFLVVKKFNQHYTLGARYADYRADEFADDVKKFWVWFDFKF
ncbi:MAG: hypothetical protein ACR2PS_12025 [Pseudomonadales bacterium]